MSSQLLDTPSSVDGVTERFDPIECLDHRVLRSAARAEQLEPGRYLAVDGPDRSLVIPLGEQPVHIGRGLAADLHLDDVSVSRRHAILLVSPDGARILDERSSNGTFLNGQPVQQAELSDSDTLAIGRFLLRYLEI